MTNDPPFVPVKQPFRGGERVVVVANEHDDRATLDLTGRWGMVCGVYPYPIDRIMHVRVMLDGESEPRGFHPSALARLDPEIDDEYWWDRQDDD